MNINAAFIGGGNMGGALIRGLIARGLPAKNISVGEAHPAASTRSPMNSACTSRPTIARR